MERQNGLTLAGLFLVLLLIMGSLSVLNYRISKQVSGIGRAQDPVSVQPISKTDPLASGSPRERRLPDGFESDPLAPVVGKRPSAVQEPVRDEPLKKVFEAAPRSDVFVN